MRLCLLILLVFLVSVSASAQAVPVGFDLSNYGVRIEPDKRLMVVLASLEMARGTGTDGRETKLIETPLSAKGEEFRRRLLGETATVDPDLRRRISAFVTQYKKQRPGATDSEIVAPFISMAYSLTPVPDLADPIVTTDLPGDLLDVLDFAPLVREFYRRSGIASRLDGYVAEYRTEADSAIRSSAREMVSELLAYLHTRPTLTFSEKVKVETKKPGSKTIIEKTEIREHERRFHIVPEKLAPKGNINFLNVRDDYYVIVPPDTDLALSEARRAYLQFVIDPIILSAAKDMTAMRAWAKPLLDELRKNDRSISADPFLAVSKSLVVAADIRHLEYTRGMIATNQARSRLDTLSKDAEKLAVSDEAARRKADEEKRAVTEELARFKAGLADESALRLYEEYLKGAVFASYFAEQLKGIEESGFDIAASIREMVATFDGTKEMNRIASTADARKRAAAAREERGKNATTLAVVTENPVTTRLREINKTIEAKNYDRANTDLKDLLTQFPNEPRIHYNIGRISSLTAAGLTDADELSQRLMAAKSSYSNVIRYATTATDPALLSLTYVALGRIYEFENQNDYAIKLYDKAIELQDVPGGAFRAAMDAKARLIKPR